MTQLSDAARLPTGALPSPERTQKGSSEAGMRSSSPEHFPYPLTARRQRADNLKARPKSPCQLPNRRGALDTWFQKSQADSQRSPPTDIPSNLHPSLSTTASPETQPHDEPLSTGSQIAIKPRRDFVPARNLPAGTPLSEIPLLPQRGPRKVGTQRRGAGINKPFISPVNDPTKVWFETGSNPNRSSRTKSPQKRPAQNQDSDQSLFLNNDDITLSTVVETEDRPPHPDLAATLDYESRKLAAMQQRRQQQAPLSSTPVASNSMSNSPHKNRYKKAVAALNSTDVPQERSSIFEAGDARAYLLRHQTPGVERDGRSKSPTRVQLRRKTAMLPLESISSDTTTLQLVLALSIQPTDLRSLERDVNCASRIDDYTALGKISNGFSQGRNTDVVRDWEERLRFLLQDHYGEDFVLEKGEVRIELELELVLQNHLAKQLDDNDEPDDATRT